MSGSQGTPPTHGACIIRTQELCRHFRLGDTLIRAVDGISLEVRSGELVAVLGSSGSGKSSVLNLIAGLDRPTSGSVMVQGRNLAQLSREELSHHRLHTVGMVFQSFNLISSMTLEENVELPMRFAEVERGKRQNLVHDALMMRWNELGWWRACSIVPANCPGASSSGPLWRARSLTVHNSCWPMSPPAISTVVLEPRS